MVTPEQLESALPRPLQTVAGVALAVVGAGVAVFASMGIVILVNRIDQPGVYLLLLLAILFQLVGATTCWQGVRLASRKEHADDGVLTPRRLRLFGIVLLAYSGVGLIFLAGEGIELACAAFASFALAHRRGRKGRPSS